MMTKIEEEFYLIGRYEDWMNLKRLVSALYALKEASLVLVQKYEELGIR